MRRFRPRASGPQTLRAYLTPERCWELPLDYAGVKDPQALLDEGFADPRADERMAVRFIVGPADESTVREARAVADRLQAERYWWPDELGAALRLVGGNVLWTVRRRASLRRLRFHEAAAERKARSQLLTMEIHLLVQASTRMETELRMSQLLEGFEAYASWSNRLRAHRPWRGRRFDRCFAEERAWPGARFVVSLEEAYALTGLPLLALATLRERQVWTRWGGCHGDDAPRLDAMTSGNGPRS